MEKGEIRQIFLKACNETGIVLAQRGFHPLRGGQAWKRSSEDGDLSFTVTFQSSHYNCGPQIMLLPILSIVSRQAKQLELVKGVANPRGFVWGLPLRALSARKSPDEWNLAGASYPHAVQEIAALLREYALPVFARFEPPQQAIAFLRAHGCLFYDTMSVQSDSLSALAFVLAHGTKQDAQAYFNGFILRCPARRRFYQLYEQLARGERGEHFLESEYLRLAYVSGLQLCLPKQHNIKGKDNDLYEHDRQLPDDR